MLKIVLSGGEYNLRYLPSDKNLIGYICREDVKIMGLKYTATPNTGCLNKSLTNDLRTI